MLHKLLGRLLRKQDGMEMVEWAMVGVIFAVTAALLWGQIVVGIDGALAAIGDWFTTHSGGGGGG